MKLDTNELVATISKEQRFTPTSAYINRPIPASWSSVTARSYEAVIKGKAIELGRHYFQGGICNCIEANEESHIFATNDLPMLNSPYHISYRFVMGGE